MALSEKITLLTAKNLDWDQAIQSGIDDLESFAWLKKDPDSINATCLSLELALWVSSLVSSSAIERGSKHSATRKNTFPTCTAKS